MGEAEFDVQVTANLASALAKFLSRRGSSETLEYRLVGDVAYPAAFCGAFPLMSAAASS